MRALEGESRVACRRRRRETAKAVVSNKRRSGNADDNDNEDEEEEEECNILTISLPINYGGRADLLQATKSLTQSILSGEIPPSALDDETELYKRLYTVNLANPDLIVRTGGERRLSNFLLWEAA